MNKEVEARFSRIERNLEITAAINAETAKILKDMVKTLDAFLRVMTTGRSNGKQK